MSDGPLTQQILGARVAEAREASRLTQTALGELVHLDRTAISKIENGSRGLSAVEFAAIGSALGRSLSWFIDGDLAQVASYRSTHAEASIQRSPADGVLDAIARDLLMLRELRQLKTTQTWQGRTTVESAGDAEKVARALREWLSQEDIVPANAPIHDVIAIADRLGMHIVVRDLPEGTPDGMYLPLDESWGVALVNGLLPDGRRRFTAVHELGHHILADECVIDWHIAGDEESEKAINAFAIHVLMPLDGVKIAWQRESARLPDARDVAVVVASRFGVSWSAALAQFQRAGLISPSAAGELRSLPPSAAEHVALEARPIVDLVAPAISPAFAAAISRAYQRQHITLSRALEMGRGALRDFDLPQPKPVPLRSLINSASDS